MMCQLATRNMVLQCSRHEGFGTTQHYTCDFVQRVLNIREPFLLRIDPVACLRYYYLLLPSALLSIIL